MPSWESERANMEVELTEMYCDVVESSKRILKENQRHLFDKMLNLLADACNTTHMIEGKVVGDDILSFWLTDISPLLFDADENIQLKAVEACESSINLIDGNVIQKCKAWKSFRETLISTYMPQLQMFGCNWQRIWGIFLNWMDNDILKDTHLLNIFLNATEKAFRSQDNVIRKDAFGTWRTLIGVFVKHSELTQPKRFKLICAPFKVSPSKTSSIAEAKLHAWWYLLTCLDSDIAQHFEAIVRPFLMYCFGNASLRSTLSAVKRFSVARQLAIPCLTKLISIEPNESLNRCLIENKLELIPTPSPLINSDTLEHNWQIIADAVLEAIRLMAAGNENSNENHNCDEEQYLLPILLQQIWLITLRFDMELLINHVCTSLASLPANHQHCVITPVLNILSTEGVRLEKSSQNAIGYGNILQSFMRLFIKSTRDLVPLSTLQLCVDKVFNLKFSSENNNQIWIVLDNLLGEIFSKNIEEDNYEVFETKLLVWKCVTQSLLNHLKNYLLDVRLKKNAKRLEDWMSWPLEIVVGFAGRRNRICFDINFCNLWIELFNAERSSPQRFQFLNVFKGLLEELLETRNEQQAFSKFFESYALAVMEFQTDLQDEREQQLSEFLSLALSIVEKPFTSRQSIEACLESLHKTFMTFKPTDIENHFKKFKEIILSMGNLKIKGSSRYCIDIKNIDALERALPVMKRTQSNQKFVTHINRIFGIKNKSDDEFVVIPSVWTLDPEKLTEHQKERMSQRSIIPALYNDLSQSQETPLKPWTPKKIIIGEEVNCKVTVESPTIKENPQDHIKDLVENINEITDTECLPNLHISASTKEISQSENTYITNNQKQKILTQTETENKDENSEKNLNNNKDSNEIKESIFEYQTCERKRRKTDNSLIMEANFRINAAVTDQLSYTINLDEVSETNNDNETNMSHKETEDDIGITRQLMIISKEKESDLLTVDIDKIINNGEELIEVSDKENIVPSESDIQLVVKETEKSLPESQITSISLSNIDLIYQPSSNESITNNETNNSIEIIKQLNISTGNNNITSKVGDISNIIPENSIIINNNSPTKISFTSSKDNSPCRIAMPLKVKLWSPPDRKLINNTTSPTIKGKFTPYLTGRGAQFINMIRNRKSDHVHNNSDVILSPIQSSSNTLESIDITIDDISTPLRSPRFLEFSKRLPLSSASPSGSILKRKIVSENLEESSFDSSIMKNKRVSFSDPPVSLMKEYLRHDDEYISKSKRYAEFVNSNLKRPRLSNVDLDIYFKNVANKSANFGYNSDDDVQIINGGIEPLAVNVNSGNFKLDEALEMVMEQCPLDTILKKFSENEFIQNLSQKSALLLAKYLSNTMRVKTTIKTKVLEILAEDHPKVFLDQAILENLPSTICNCLKFESIVDYMVKKAIQQNSYRDNLFSKLIDIFKNNEVQNDQNVKNFLTHALQQFTYTDEEGMNLISIITKCRLNNNNKSTMDINNTINHGSNDNH